MFDYSQMHGGDEEKAKSGGKLSDSDITVMQQQRDTKGKQMITDLPFSDIWKLLIS